jgi:DNA-binding transcriptional MocR family regulator
MKPRGFRWLWLDHVHDYTKAGLLTNHASHIAHILAVNYTNGKNEAWPTQQTLAATAGVSEKTIRQALQNLEQQGFLTSRKGAPAATFGNVYTLSNPVQFPVLDGLKHGTLDRVGPQRESVGPNRLTLSRFQVSPLSNTGDQILTCSTGPDYRVRSDP